MFFSVETLPDEPSGIISPSELKKRFTRIVFGEQNSAFAEIDRVVDEVNTELQARDNALNEHINNAEIHKPNVIEKILINDVEKQPDIDKAVNITAEDLGAGKPNGLATLDENQRLKTEQLPEGINVYEYYDSIEDFPETGESGVTYIDRSTNNVYLWTGSDYTNITAQLALGETSNTAYRGDRGKIAYDHSQSTGNPHQTAFDEILDKPTTLAGYGITDALKKGDQSKVVNDAFTHSETQSAGFQTNARYTCNYYINSRTLTCERSWSGGYNEVTFNGGSITAVLAYCPVQNRYYFGTLT